MAKSRRQRGAPKLSPNHLKPEVRMAEQPKQIQPQWQEHLRSARLGDVTQVNDVPPAQAFQQCRDFILGLHVVPADQHRWVAAFRGINHDLAVYDVQCFHDFGRRDRFLNFLAQRVSIADRKRQRRTVGSIQRITHIDQLRELERDGIVARKVYGEAPPKVEYSLTKYGLSLRPLLNELCDWGRRHEKRAIGKPGLSSGQDRSPPLTNRKSTNLLSA